MRRLQETHSSLRPVAPDEAATALFKTHFGYTPSHHARAPGRVELLGHRTERHQGLALSAAVDRYVAIACGPRSDGRIELVASAFPEKQSFWISEMPANPEARWADYIKGVLIQLRKHGVNFSGFNAAIHGIIPMGIGMGSSAALQVAAALAIRQLYPFTLTEAGATIPPKRNERGQLPPLPPSERLPLARLCRDAERELTGKLGNLVDALSSLCGKAWHVVSVDCRFETVEVHPLLGAALILCDTGVRPADRGNEVDDCCNAALEKLAAQSLRSVEMNHLQANRARLSPREFACAHHVVGEIARVVAAERALRDDDQRQLGQYLFQSHESSRHGLLDSCEELDLLVDLAQLRPGCLGARMTGRGHGGAIVSLVSYHEAEGFVRHIAAAYEERTGHRLDPVVCQIVDGAS